jgi:hypothetical protein
VWYGRQRQDRGRSRRLGAEDWVWSSTGWVLSGRMIKRSGDAVCGLHRAQGDEECGFLGLASKPRSTVSPGLASKPVPWFLWFGLKTTRSDFPVWVSKPVVVIW